MVLNNVYFIAKSLHLIGMVSWMAGMFYLVRIMVYHAMALDKSEPERSLLCKQFNEMEWKSYNIILKPAVIITWTFGIFMLCIQPAWLHDGWMQAKLVFLILLTAYSWYLRSHIVRLDAGSGGFTHIQYRALNEVPTIFMVAIIFLAVFRNGINYLALFTGILLFTGLIAWGIKRANAVK